MVLSAPCTMTVRIAKPVLVGTLLMMTLACAARTRSGVCPIPVNDQFIVSLRAKARAYAKEHSNFRTLAVDFKHSDARVFVLPYQPFAKTIPWCYNGFDMTNFLPPYTEEDVSHLFPTFVYMRPKRWKALMCGGIFIGRKWILTSAHCLLQAPFSEFIAYNYNWNSSGRHQTYTHPDYYRQTDHQDIGLVHVSIPHTEISEPCHPNKGEDEPDTGEDKCIAFKWIAKKTPNDRTKWILTHQKVKVHDTNKNYIHIKHPKLKEKLAFYEGPVLCEVEGKMTLVGIMSHAHCASNFLHHPSVSRLTTFLGWIASTIEKHDGEM